MSGSIKEQIGWEPKAGGDLVPYLKPVLPPLDANKLLLDLLESDERGIIKRTHTYGDFSLLLSYKGAPAFVSSFSIYDTALYLEQLQGVKGKASFRVAAGVDCIKVIADYALQIATSLSLAQIAMPVPWAISGISPEMDKMEAAVNKYFAFASLAGLSLVDDKYVRDLALT